MIRRSEIRGRFELSSGWIPAIGAVVMAGTGAIVATTTAVTFGWVVLRVELIAVAVLAAGVAVGAERAVAAAPLPALGGVMIGAGGGGSVAWGWSIVIGCAWYVAVELGLASIDVRDGAQRTAALALRRGREISTVVAVATGVGMAGLLLTSYAPQRTLALRAVTLAALIMALGWGLRHLTATADPSTDR